MLVQVSHPQPISWMPLKVIYTTWAPSCHFGKEASRLILPSLYINGTSLSRTTVVTSLLPVMIMLAGMIFQAYKYGYIEYN